MIFERDSTQSTQQDASRGRPPGDMSAILKCSAVVLTLLIASTLFYQFVITPGHVRNADSVSIGMTEEEVRELLGEPTEREEGRWSYRGGGGSGSLDISFQNGKVDHKDLVWAL